LKEHKLTPDQISKIGASGFSETEWLSAWGVLQSWVKAHAVPSSAEYEWEYLNCAAHSPEALVGRWKFDRLVQFLLEREGYEGIHQN
jgi:hypothetical protein